MTRGCFVSAIPSFVKLRKLPVRMVGSRTLTYVSSHCSFFLTFNEGSIIASNVPNWLCGPCNFQMVRPLWLPSSDICAPSPQVLRVWFLSLIIALQSKKMSLTKFPIAGNSIDQESNFFSGVRPDVRIVNKMAFAFQTVRRGSNTIYTFSEHFFVTLYCFPFWITNDIN